MPVEGDLPPLNDLYKPRGATSDVCLTFRVHKQFRCHMTVQTVWTSLLILLCLRLLSLCFVCISSLFLLCSRFLKKDLLETQFISSYS